MTTVTRMPSPSKSQYKVIGTRPIRHDGLDKVTGRAQYGADLQLPNLLHARILRSPHPHARIRSIDTSKAAALPGVKAVITGKDFPAKPLPVSAAEVFEDMNDLSKNQMARDKVLYKGHAVAAVAAVSVHVAEEALSLIKVDYEVLPAAFDVRAAMQAGAPVLHEHIKFGPGEKAQPSNIASRLELKRGDVEKGFAEADVIVEREFTTKAVHQGYIEPHNSTAYWAPDGNVTVWKSTQAPFIVRAQTAAILNHPTSKIKVIPMEIGGGFGGKIPSYTDGVVALLSKQCGHPVKYVMTRQEVFEGTGPTSGSYMKIKLGAKKNGVLTAAKLYLAYEAGAFPGSPVGAGAATCLAPYKIANFFIEGYDVVVNKPKVIAYRAPGSPIAALAVESVIDELAQRLGLDPLELRLKLAPSQGDRDAYDIAWGPIGCVEVERALMDHPHYKTPLKGANRGRGIAMGYWFNVGLQSSATVSVNSDGGVSLVTGSADIGGTRAACAMQVAEVLGLRAEDVHPSVGDTDSIGYTSCTGGSRTAFSTGIASINAAERAKAEMIRRAALLWETQPADVAFANGTFTSKKNPQDKLTWKELAGKLMQTGGPVSESGSSDPKVVGPSFGGMLVDVEVDPETGKVTVLRCTAAIDAGTAAHPAYVEGQIQGGAVQGIGWALNEEYFYTGAGTMANSSFLDYRLPLGLDLPMIDAIIVEVPAPGHPFGLRGVGEIPIVAPLGAMANAVSRATGVRMTSLPMTPGYIVSAIQAAKGKNGKR